MRLSLFYDNLDNADRFVIMMEVSLLFLFKIYHRSILAEQHHYHLYLISEQLVIFL